MKIAVLGYSGSGKSTLAKYFGSLYGIPVLYLDRVHFLPGWKVRKTDDALALVSKFMEQDSWVIDGNYTKYLQKERLSQADRIIYMRFSRCACLWRILKRYFRYRKTSRESIAEGCEEKIDAEFLRWILFDGRSRAKQAHAAEILQTYPGKTTMLKNQRQLSEFMRSPFSEKKV